MCENYFTGDKKSLFEYWQDPERVKKFTTGGTRTPMVDLVLEEDLPLLLGRNWLDIGGGPGYIQTRLGLGKVRLPTVLDISFSALLIHMLPETQRVCGSFEFMPFRKNSFDVISIFFCLSDYPSLPKILLSFLEYVEETIICVDYSAGDQYWETRRRRHGADMVGNINLRTVGDVADELRGQDVEVVRAVTHSFRTSSETLRKHFPDFGEFITRKFFHLVLKKTPG